MSADNVATGSGGGDETNNCSAYDAALQVKKLHESHCQILKDLKPIIYKIPTDLNTEKISEWRKQVSDMIECKLPQVVIALIGETGSGKSSLLNAIIEQDELLPTSGTQASTATVVRVQLNDNSTDYEADVEFLTREEWLRNINLLMDDLKDDEGQIPTKKPENDEVAAVAWCKIQAVYGKVDPSITAEELCEAEFVKKRLGTSNQVQHKSIIALKKDICGYIKSGVVKEGQKGGALWPLVKQVDLRLPGIDVLTSGAVLVDLPGTGDSNEARVAIAKTFLKQCHSLWIVARIERAADSSHTQKLLENYITHELVMDGKLTNLAFVCSKSESDIDPSKMREEFSDDLEIQIAVDEFEKSEDDQAHDVLKMIAKEKCALGRNKFCKNCIRENYSSAVKKMMEGARGDIEENSGKQASLQDIFCCSAKEYLKFSAQSKKRENPKVFSSEINTDIPAVKEFIHKLTTTCRRPQVYENVEKLRIFVIEVVDSLQRENSRVESTKKEFDDRVGILRRDFNQITLETNEQIKSHFANITDNLLSAGVKEAKRTAEQTSAKWSRIHGYPTYKAVVTPPRYGEYQSATSASKIDFNADLSRPLHVSIASAWNNVFEHQIPKALDTFRNKILTKHQDFCSKLHIAFCQVPGVSAENLVEVHSAKATTVFIALHPSDIPLVDRLRELKTEISEKQKDIHRVMTPTVKHRMTPVYEECYRKRRKDAYKKMQESMSTGIKENIDMFDDARKELWSRLQILREDIDMSLNAATSAVTRYLESLYEPLWKSPSKSREQRTQLANEILQLREKLFNIYMDAGMDVKSLECLYTLANDTLPAVSVAESAVPRNTRKRKAENDDDEDDPEN